MPINIPFAKDDITKFAADLQKYFAGEAKKIKKGDNSISQEAAGFFLNIPDRLEQIIHEIDKAQEAATIEVQREIENNPRMQNLSQEQIREIIAVKKREKIEKAGILRSLFVIACASDKEMSKCLEFAQKYNIKDLNSFDETINSAVEISPLAAAMLRRRKNISAMKELERAGADIHAVSMRGNNIAHMISYFGGNKKLIDHLIKNKVNFNVANKMGFTALDVAVGRRDVLFIRYLKEKADAKFKFTPLNVQKQIEQEEERVFALAKARVRELVVAHAAAKIRRAKMPNQNVSAVETFSSNAMLNALQNYNIAEKFLDQKDVNIAAAETAQIKELVPIKTEVKEVKQENFDDEVAKKDVKKDTKNLEKIIEKPQKTSEIKDEKNDNEGSLLSDIIGAFSEGNEDNFGLIDLVEALAEEALEATNEFEKEIIWFFDDESDKKKEGVNQQNEKLFSLENKGENENNDEKSAILADKDLTKESFVQKVTEQKLDKAENSQQGQQSASAA